MISISKESSTGKSDIVAASAVIQDAMDTQDKLMKYSQVLCLVSEVYADDSVSQEERTMIADAIGEADLQGTYTYVSTTYGMCKMTVTNDDILVDINGTDTSILQDGGVDTITFNGIDEVDLIDLVTEVNNSISTQQALIDITNTMLNGDINSYSDVASLINQYSYDGMGDFRAVLLGWLQSGDISLNGWLNQINNWYKNMDSATTVGQERITFQTDDPITKNLFNTVIMSTATTLVSAVTMILGYIHPVFLFVSAALSVVSSLISSIKSTIAEAQTNPVVQERSKSDVYVTAFGQTATSDNPYGINEDIFEVSDTVRYITTMAPGVYVNVWQDNIGPFSYQEGLNIEGKISLSYDWDLIWTQCCNSNILAYENQDYAPTTGQDATDTVPARINAKWFLRSYQNALNSFGRNKVYTVHDTAIYNAYTNPYYLLQAGLLVRLAAYCVAHRADWDSLGYINFTMHRNGNYPHWMNVDSYSSFERTVQMIQALRWIQRDNGETNDTRNMIHPTISWIKDNFNYLHNTSFNEASGWACISDQFSVMFGPNSSYKNDVGTDLIIFLTDYDDILSEVFGYDINAISYLGAYLLPTDYYLYPPNYDATTLKASYAKLIALVVGVTVVVGITAFLAKRWIKRRVTMLATNAGKLRNDLNKATPQYKSIKQIRAEWDATHPGQHMTKIEGWRAWRTYNNDVLQPQIDSWNATYKQYNKAMWAYTIMASLTGVNGLPTAGAVSPLLQTVTGSWMGSKLAQLGSKGATDDMSTTDTMLEIVNEKLDTLMYMIGGNLE